MILLLNTICNRNSTILPNFNTTLVIVQLGTNVEYASYVKFQYNSCYCSTCRRVAIWCGIQVSIQLLLLFNSKGIIFLISQEWVSIQLLLLFNGSREGIRLEKEGFNTTLVIVQLSISCLSLNVILVSIQLLLLFNGVCYHTEEDESQFQYNSCYCSTKRNIFFTISIQFQYNSCYCSTYSIRSKGMDSNSFNTTLVIVQHHLKLIMCAVTSVSIQLLLLFNIKKQEK